mgnify:CR=1 FL=1
MAEWFNSHHHDTVTAVREIDIIRAATGRCYMFSHKGIRHSLNDYKELDASKVKNSLCSGRCIAGRYKDGTNSQSSKRKNWHISVLHG